MAARQRSARRQAAFRGRTMRDWERAADAESVTRRAKKRKRSADTRLKRMLMDEGE